MTRAQTIALSAAALALSTAVGIAIVAPHRDLAGTPAYRGTPLTPPRLATDFVLTDANGTPAHVLDRNFAATFLFFGYTHCPDACPLAMAALGRAYRMLTPAQASRTRIVFVTVDPALDTPAVVRRYVTAFGSRIVGLTGTAATLARVWRSYGVVVDAKTREIGHGDVIDAIDAGGRIVLIYPPSTTAADLARDAATLTAHL